MEGHKDTEPPVQNNVPPFGKFLSKDPSQANEESQGVIQTDSKQPFEIAISGSMDGFEIDHTRQTVDSKPLFDLFYFCRKHPIMEITTLQLPEGSRALEDYKLKSQRTIPGKSDNANLGFMASALKSLSDGFALDPFAQAPGSSRTQLTTVKQKKLKVKYGTWVYPKLSNDDGTFRKEANYLLDNILRDRSPTRVGATRSEVVESYLDGVFCPNFSHLDDNIIVVPLQDAATSVSFHSASGSLLSVMNPEGNTYSIVYSKSDFTVLDTEVYSTDVLFCVKTYYPFVSFFCRVINLILSKSTLTQMKSNSNDSR